MAESKWTYHTRYRGHTIERDEKHVGMFRVDVGTWDQPDYRTGSLSQVKTEIDDARNSYGKR